VFFCFLEQLWHNLRSSNQNDIISIQQTIYPEATELALGHGTVISCRDRQANIPKDSRERVDVHRVQEGRED
jgi:hypothetical protein